MKMRVGPALPLFLCNKQSLFKILVSLKHSFINGLNFLTFTLDPLELRSVESCVTLNWYVAYVCHYFWAVDIFILFFLQVLDIKAEVVNLAMSEPTSVDELPSRIPTESARYHLFRFNHSYEGDSFNSVGMFLFSSCVQIWRINKVKVDWKISKTLLDC